MKADQRLTPRVVEEIREAIADADGNEVFLVGRVGEDGRVEAVTVGARGNEEAVPVLAPHIWRRGRHHPQPPFGRAAAQQRGPRRGRAARETRASASTSLTTPWTPSTWWRSPWSFIKGRPLMRSSSPAHLAPGGTLSRLYPLYEERESQIAMLRLVCKSFNGDELCAAEAGTGVGKSLAYLLPAISWALRNKERVVVSTNTINLQQQLMDKDIPLVKRILGEDPKVVLVKGRRNYLCLHRLNEALDELSLFEEQDPEILAIREWARTTETGSRTDLSFFPSEESWSRVCSEADACLGLRCSHREGCFVLKARREASSAQVLVANHHLLFSDLAFRLAGSGFDDPAVLPPFRRVVFDEAHNIEKAATSFFSQSFSRFALQRFLGRLHRRVGGTRGARGGGDARGARGGGDAQAGGEAGSGRGRVRGHIAALSRLLGRNALTGKAPRLVDDIREEAQELDTVCLELMGDETALLLDSSSLAGFIDRVGPSLAALAGSIRRLGELFDELLEKVSEKNPPQETQNIVWDCKVQLARLFRDRGPVRQVSAGGTGAGTTFSGWRQSRGKAYDSLSLPWTSAPS